MKVLLISAPNSTHTLKIANSLHERGIEIVVYGIGDDSLNNLYHKDIIIENHKINPSITSRSDGNLSKLAYLSILPKLKKILNKFKPDIVHSHYASSHGLIGHLLNFHPFIVSVWGGDVYDFPKKNIFNRFILKRVLNSADLILSTSNAMSLETKQYTIKPIEVIPFGINTNKFRSLPVKDNNSITLGIIKPLEKYYGIEFLIEAFKLLEVRLKGINLKLMIVGKGSLRNIFEDLVASYKLSDKVFFTGYINYDIIEQYHNKFDIGCYLSVEESFGVSIIESLACEVPVVASNVGGIPELVIDGENGVLVPVGDVEKTVQALEKLILNKKLRKEMGKKGRGFVQKNFEWSLCVDAMIEAHKKLLL